MPSVPQTPNRKQSPRNKRRAELRAEQRRQSLPALPKSKPRFPTRALSEESDTLAARARSKALDSLLRAKMGWPVFGENPDAIEAPPATLRGEDDSGGTNAKPVTKRRFEPRHEGP